ncbi:hypothetical protein Kpol_543p38 [Vanderwaltozyma polyspora DSM 70294]|uniref:Uncharacterized protein n=1 Tax=Vanderwaltozyma polyspora (strain ATCC 22028 / DSM 70294 / BCRC 21397 / CBS 2163 / NBRC 10782 / NRRL Y-8283 / UCD 57-17) TaxID=436907 RepID=A7THP2_VANPO|nr:uncharacterized protein Kpol_543p38 [Vanderwaltozyma polyspora DSM 70294]EDO18208.1 hypothetical protein Kpol_543p38 [Vanderwaltozyma polyspora DSM 70294]
MVESIIIDEDRSISVPSSNQVIDDTLAPISEFKEVNRYGKVVFDYPKVGATLYEYIDSSYSVPFLEFGRGAAKEYLDSIIGTLSQTVYELIRDDLLDVDTLSEKTRWSRINANAKCLYLKRRYKLTKKGTVIDLTRENKIVYEPDLRYDYIISTHILNRHLGYQGIHKRLKAIYSNLSRDYIKMVLDFCSHCNPDKVIPNLEKTVHMNIYEKYLPLERVQLDIFEPFENEKIQNRYSHIIYIRDYRSRFVWIYPLKNTKFKTLASEIGMLLLDLPRIPIYIDTTTIERRDMLAICKRIAEKYEISLGIGTIEPSSFYSIGLSRLKCLLNENKDKCLKDWNMCLKLGSYYYNKKSITTARGVPSELFLDEMECSATTFESKRTEIINSLPIQNSYKTSTNKGLVYAQDEILTTSKNKSSNMENGDDTFLEYDDTFIEGSTNFE